MYLTIKYSVLQLYSTTPNRLSSLISLYKKALPSSQPIRIQSSREREKEMEGLIPFVIHALKKNRNQRTYRCLSDGSNAGGSSRKAMMDWTAQDGSSHHRRTRSEFPTAATADPGLFSGDSRLAPSRSLKAGEESFFSPISRVAELTARRG
ncbi:uncharacterized protein LOC110027245 [Phalaenopsis equestris]|uniref:uncharacterized protein LOC110027245 n=1 Tax=Phalaenopsis equestris TaxID=78828 RepID=UPI0009E3492F|nr:uncharacterized protein LOC110027245 [Phalaenopsis equestris]